MKTSSGKSFNSHLRSASLAAAALLMVSSASAQLPESTLVATVQEQADGSVTISLSGTAYAGEPGDFDVTPVILDEQDPSPPHTLQTSQERALPEGLTLTVPANQQMNSEPEGAEPLQTVLPVTHVIFSEIGAWALGHFQSNEVSEEEGSASAIPVPFWFVEFGDPIVGAGSVNVSNVPFSNFVPGTYVIPYQTRGSDPEEGPRFFSNFEITYKVIPYSGAGLTLSGPGAFPATRVDRTSRYRRVRIQNVGTSPVTVSSISVTGALSDDFEVQAGALPTIAPGGKAVAKVRFRPSAKGRRRATLEVKSSAPKVTTGLSGFGLGARTSPRFPKGPL